MTSRTLIFECAGTFRLERDAIEGDVPFAVVPEDLGTGDAVIRIPRERIGAFSTKTVEAK